MAGLIAPVNAQGGPPSTTSTPVDAKDYEQRAAAEIQVDNSAAVVDLERAIELAPDHYDNYLRLTDICTALHSFDAAALFLRRQIARYPIDTPLALIKGAAGLYGTWSQYSQQTGDTKGAIEHSWSAYELYKGPFQEGAALELFVLCNNYSSIGDFKNQLKCARECLNIGQSLRNNKLLGDAYMQFAMTYMVKGIYGQGLVCARLAVDHFVKAGDARAVPLACDIAADICKRTGKQEDELVWRERAFKVSQGVDVPTLNAAAIDLANAYAERRQFDQAIPFLKLLIDSTRQDRLWTDSASACASLASVYTALDEPDLAVPLLAEAVDDDLKSSVMDARTRGHRIALSAALADSGQFDLAKKIAEETADDAAKASDAPSQYSALEAAAHAYAQAGNLDKAIEVERKSLDVLRQDPVAEIYGCGVLAAYYRKQGNLNEATRWYSKSTDAARRYGDATGEIINSVELSDNLVDQQRLQKALDTVTQPIIKYPNVEVDYTPRLYAMLMYIEAGRGRLPAATIFGKQAVQAWQRQRRDLKPVGEEAQDLAFLPAVGTYRWLTAILIRQNRLSEALQVYDLMKRKEFEEYTNSKDKDAWPVPLTPAEKAIFDHRQKLIKAVAVAENKAQQLSEQKREADLGVATFDDADRRKQHQAVKAAEKARASYAVLMTSIEKNFTTQPATTIELVDHRGPLAGGTAVVYTLVTEDALYLIALDKRAHIWKSSKIAGAVLAKKIGAFREAIQDPTIDVSRPATDLYNLLVKPIEPWLKQEHATRLLWSLDGVLRYCPMAALFDGRHYLIERYSCEEFTVGKPARLTATADVDEALGLGVTKPHPGFEALPNVREELGALVRDPGDPRSGGLLDGVTMLDDRFTRESMVTALKSGKFRTVHIASHFEFQPGDDTKSFLLLGDGDKFSLADMKSMPDLFGNVDMLTLSACQTAVGSTRADGREIDGCAVIAQRDGAKTVVASLWPIADASTPVLMHTFYQLRRDDPSISKSEALRQAQLALLTGASTVPSGASIPHVRGGPADNPSPEDDVANLPDFHADQTKPFAHPYYWAPFVLISASQ